MEGNDQYISVIPMKALLQSGVHFGHRTNKWDPRMEPYIFTKRNGIHIIDLRLTSELLTEAYNVVRDTAAKGGVVLFVGTKSQAQKIIAEEATRCGMPYVTQRWMGGMLTNFSTMYTRIQELERLEKLRAKNEAGYQTKKEELLFQRAITRLSTRLSGARSMQRPPDLLFIVDVGREETAVHEANLLDIPIVALVDTNCNPRNVDYVIPANDDASTAIKLLVSKIADAVLEGRLMQKEEATSQRAEKIDTRLGSLDEYEILQELSDEGLLGESTLEKIRGKTDILAAQEAAPEASRARQMRTFVEQQFGRDEKWERIAEAIWDFFALKKDWRIGLSAMQEIAEQLHVSLDDVLSAVSLLANPNQGFLEQICYRLLPSGRVDSVSDDEVLQQTRLYIIEKSISDAEWQEWANNVLIGWQSTIEVLEPYRASIARGRSTGLDPMERKHPRANNFLQ